VHVHGRPLPNPVNRNDALAVYTQKGLSPVGRCANGVSSLPSWPVVLKAVSSHSPRSERFAPARPTWDGYLDEQFERMFELDEGQVRMCLHVISGRPGPSYGVSVGV
jgi:hypothetical protein